MTYSFTQSPNKNSRRSGAAINSIILHFTASATLAGTLKWFQNSEAKVSAHYVIGRGGEVVQMVHEHERAWHAGLANLDGERDVNSVSIGVELVNWGELRTADGNTFFCWPDSYTRPYSVEEFGRPYNCPNGRWWAPYPKEQVQALTKLCQEVVARYPDITRERIVGHEHVSPGRKNDPGPALDLEKLREEVFSSAEQHLYSDTGGVVPEPSQAEEERGSQGSWVSRLYARWTGRHGS